MTGHLEKSTSDLEGGICIPTLAGMLTALTPHTEPALLSPFGECYLPPLRRCLRITPPKAKMLVKRHRPCCGFCCPRPGDSSERSAPLFHWEEEKVPHFFPLASRIGFVKLTQAHIFISSIPEA